MSRTTPPGGVPSRLRSWDHRKLGMPEMPVDEENKVNYTAVMDMSHQVQLAFAGQVSPNAVPTTIVVDREGRVEWHEVLGEPDR